MSLPYVPQDGNLTNPVVGSPNLYTGKLEWSSFDYKVSTPVCVFFVAMFALSTVLHLGQALKSRRWFLLYTLVMAATAESLGWAFRLWAALAFKWSPLLGGEWFYPHTTFTAQVAILIIGPVFSTAANYILLGLLVSLLGHQYCRLAPKTYTALFITGDILCLLIQAFGGGIAGSASTTVDANKGAKIMVIGVIVQMVVMTLYSLVFIEFVTRYLLDRPVARWEPFSFISNLRRNRRRRSLETLVPLGSGFSSFANAETALSPKDERHARILIGGLAGSTLLIFVRSGFRTVELLDGWTGKLATNQVLFSILDGGMILLSSLLLNILHPMFLLRNGTRARTEKDLGAASSPHYEMGRTGKA